MQKQQALYRKSNPRDEGKINVSTALQRLLNGTPDDREAFAVTGCDWVTLQEWLKFTGKMYTRVDAAYQYDAGCVIDTLYPIS